MPWIEANGASLRYEMSGTGKETLVLMHEAGGCLESYEETLPGLEKEFRVLRYDQRGFGFSEKVRELTFEGVVADLSGLLDALKITAPVHLAGCARGIGFKDIITFQFAAAFSAFGCTTADFMRRHSVSTQIDISAKADDAALAEFGAKVTRVWDDLTRTAVDEMIEDIQADVPSGGTPGARSGRCRS